MRYLLQSFVDWLRPTEAKHEPSIDNERQDLVDEADHPDAFLNLCKGIVHVGANSGQERDTYASYGLKVVWIEPIPEVFAELEANLEGYKDQVAIQALLTDQEGQRCTLHVSNIDGQASSILDLNQCLDIWPSVDYVRDIEIVSSTLPIALSGANVDHLSYDALILDTQGTELQVLKGAREILSCFKYIKTEAADFEAYTGCALVSQLDDFLGQEGFRRTRADKFAERELGGAYFDLLYERII